MEKIMDGIYRNEKGNLVFDFEKLLLGCEDDFKTEDERESYEDGYVTAWDDAEKHFNGRK